jgi:hypothetical protein
LADGFLKLGKVSTEIVKFPIEFFFGVINGLSGRENSGPYILDNPR